MDRPVVVVGGGIAGCTVALELRARGTPVTLIERDQPGAGATGASAGMLAPQYEAGGAGAAFDFGVRSREEWPGLVERIEGLSQWEVGLRTDGMLVANRTGEEEEGAAAALGWQRSAGLRGELLSPAEATRLHPGLSAGPRSWLWLPDEAQLDAQRLAVGLADATRGAGARVAAGREVVAMENRAGRVTAVRLSGGERVETDQVVLAAGAWSAQVGGLPRILPVRPVRGQILRLRPASPLPWTLVADHQAHYLVPRINGTILVGSTMEDVGFEEGVTEAGSEALAEAADSLVPSLGAATVVERWSGLRPISADGGPVLGPDPELEGLFYATGAGRNGILFAARAARAVADLVTQGSTDIRWEAFGVDRFLASGAVRG